MKQTDQGFYIGAVIWKITNYFDVPYVAVEMAADEAKGVHCYLLPNFRSRDVCYKYLRQRRLYK